MYVKQFGWDSFLYLYVMGIAAILYFPPRCIDEPSPPGLHNSSGLYIFNMYSGVAVAFARISAYT